jgi:hypothetical protein
LHPTGSLAEIPTGVASRIKANSRITSSASSASRRDTSADPQESPKNRKALQGPTSGSAIDIAEAIANARGEADGRPLGTRFAAGEYGYGFACNSVLLEPSVDEGGEGG